MLEASEIAQLIHKSGVGTWTGVCTALGGGEMNDSYRIDLQERTVVLRIEKQPNQQSLKNEAASLQLLMGTPGVPALLYYNPTDTYNNRQWIVESFVSGAAVTRLTTVQFHTLGACLARVHKIEGQSPSKSTWDLFVLVCSNFGDEACLRNHSHTPLRTFVSTAESLFVQFDAVHRPPIYSLIHGDATPSNLLLDGNTVQLIDWEFSRFADPMMEFSTIYYDDMEYNQGKWRVQITPEEKAALFAGYRAAGGEIDEQRISFWMWFDKLGAAVFLYWRLHEAPELPTGAARAQYEHDFNQLLVSLERTVPT